MLNLFSNYLTLSRRIYFIAGANVINSLGSFVRPLLALLLTDKLGMGKGRAGLFVTLITVASIFGFMAGGKWADRFGRKNVYLVSTLLGVAALIPCAFLGASPLIPWLLALMFFMYSVARPTLGTMATDLSALGERQYAFSLLYLGSNLGFAVGALLAGFLYLEHTRLIYLGDALTTIVSVVLIWCTVAETIPPSLVNKAGKQRPVYRRGEETAGSAEILDSKSVPAAEISCGAATGPGKAGMLAILFSSPALMLFLLASIIFSFVYEQGGFSLPIQLREALGQSGPALYGVLMSANAITCILFTPLLTRLLSRFSPLLNVAIGGILYAVGFGMIYWNGGPVFLIISTWIWSLGEVIEVISVQVYLLERAPVTHRGRFNSLAPVANSVGASLGPPVMGILIDNYGVRMVWPFCFLLALAAVLLAFSLYRSERKAGAASGDRPGDVILSTAKNLIYERPERQTGR